MNQVNKQLPEISELQQRVLSCDKKIDTLINQELTNRDPQKTPFFRRTFFLKFLIVIAYFYVAASFVEKATVVTLDYFFGNRS